MKYYTVYVTDILCVRIVLICFLFNFCQCIAGKVHDGANVIEDTMLVKIVDNLIKQ